MRIAVGLCMAGMFLSVNASAVDVYTGPLFDVHCHSIPSKMSLAVMGSSGQNVVEALIEAGLSGAVLIGPPFSTLQEHENHPEFAYPFAPVRRDWQTREVVLNTTTLETLEMLLQRDLFWGLGELSLRHVPAKMTPPEGDQNPADSPMALGIYDLAAKYGVPVLIHLEHGYSKELERALEHNREAIIIWAHSGDGQAGLVGELLRRHPNLYADLSSRNPYYKRKKVISEQSLADEKGRLKPEWKQVFEEFPDRFLFGLDLGAPGRVEVLDKVLAYYRSIFGELSPGTAERIAYGNARRLLKKKP